ncbi:MAG: dicarboxylate/amino acid:cation symporter [Gemmatimonadetes bacterium]|nr:dicarboxylate/amino acid:cation symporter [Gemmatimonadota bacterium]
MTDPSNPDAPNELVDSLSLIQRYRRLSLGVKILLFMVLGIVAGILAGERAEVVQPLGDLFIRLLMMGVIPLVFFNLLAGITSLTDPRSLGRVGAKIVAYYLTTTVAALTLGLTAMHILKPGNGMQLREKVDAEFGQVPDVADVFIELIPRNIFESFASGQVAQVVVFAIFLGLATLFLPEEPRGVLRRAFGALAEVLRKLVGIVLYFAPIGIGALAAATVGRYGAAIFGPLALFIVGIWAAQAVMVVVYMTLLVTFTRRSPLEFLTKTAPLYATTAATCSSLASLAVSLDIAERRLHLPRSIYSFTLPLGAQLNKDGTSIMLAGVLLFTAQAAGVDFSLASQVTIVLIGLVLSEGSGGIPGGGLVIALIFVQAFNLPLEIAALVGGIYRLIDMSSTTINCMGDLVGTVIVAHSERGKAVTPAVAS